MWDKSKNGALGGKATVWKVSIRYLLEESVLQLLPLNSSLDLLAQVKCYANEAAWLSLTRWPTQSAGQRVEVHLEYYVSGYQHFYFVDTKSFSVKL